jgi:drug/metabolite transporter (DMT)-like permease
MRLKSDFILLLIAIIWGSAFVAQRLAAQNMGFFLFNALRFFIAALFLFIMMRFRLSLPKKEWGLTFLTGCVLCIASFLQQAGLRWTTAGNAGFITSLYVMIVPIVMFIFWQQKISRRMLVISSLAVLGAYFLSTAGQKIRFSPGDSLEFVGAVFWALHVALIGWAAKRIHPIQFTFGQLVVAGTIQLVFAVIFDLRTIPALADSWWTAVYTGIFSMGLGYTLQAYAQRYAPPADAALILSAEGVFAALGGWLFLREALLPIQILGCSLIFTAVVLSQFPSQKTTN